MKSRKGMSPLIATVLLIAFAVALGAMIMNWEPRSTAGCSSILLSTQEFCFDGKTIKINVKNEGTQEASKLMLQFENGGQWPIENSRLAPERNLRVEVEGPPSVDVGVGILPYIEISEEQEIPCPPPQQMQNPLQACS